MLCGIVSGLSQPNLPAASVRVAASKIPEVTVWFWITKVLITGANVAWPDYLYRQFGVVLVGGGIGLVFLAILALQFSLRSYNTWTYWLTVRSERGVAGLPLPPVRRRACRRWYRLSLLGDPGTAVQPPKLQHLDLLADGRRGQRGRHRGRQRPAHRAELAVSGRGRLVSGGASSRLGDLARQ